MTFPDPVYASSTSIAPAEAREFVEITIEKRTPPQYNMNKNIYESFMKRKGSIWKTSAI